MLPERDFAVLLAESEAEGFHFIDRVMRQWESGENRFARRGEALLAAATNDDGIAGICGLMLDPYLDQPGVGRLRNLYVRPAYRRHRLGERLGAAAVGAARGSFDLLRLRSSGPEATRLYERLGFRPVTDVDVCTHVLKLGAS